MGEEQGLSAENRALVERADMLPLLGGKHSGISLRELNMLLNAARSEGLQPPVGEVEEEVFSSLGASKAPSCGSPTVAETPSEDR